MIIYHFDILCGNTKRGHVHVKTLCLAILSMGDASGYEIKKLLEGPFSHIHEASFGAIYPALARLQQDGHVTCEERSQEKRPDKKVYSLTQKGRFELVEELSVIPGPDRIRSDFLVVMLYAHLMPAAHIAQAIDKRLDIYRGLLAELKDENREPVSAGEQSSAAFVHGYGKTILEASLNYIEENRHLVEGAALLAEPAKAEPQNASPKEHPTGVAAE